MSYPNQRKIYIQKAVTPKQPFVALNKNTMAAVFKDLKNASAFYLYLCLCSNKANFGMDFSPTYIEKWFGLDEATARAAIKRLDANGYIVPVNDKNRLFNFHETPEHIKVKIEENRQMGYYFDSLN